MVNFKTFFWYLDVCVAVLLTALALVSLYLTGPKHMIYFTDCPAPTCFHVLPTSLLIFTGFFIIVAARDAVLAPFAMVFSGALYELTCGITTSVLSQLNLRSSPIWILASPTYIAVILSVTLSSLLLIHLHKTKLHFTWLLVPYLAFLILYYLYWPLSTFFLNLAIVIEIVSELFVCAVAWRILQPPTNTRLCL